MSISNVEFTTVKAPSVVTLALDTVKYSSCTDVINPESSHSRVFKIKKTTPPLTLTSLINCMLRIQLPLKLDKSLLTLQMHESLHLFVPVETTAQHSPLQINNFKHWFSNSPTRSLICCKSVQERKEGNEEIPKIALLPRGAGASVSLPVEALSSWGYRESHRCLHQTPKPQKLFEIIAPHFHFCNQKL